VHDALIAYGPGAATPGQPPTGADHHIGVGGGSAWIGDRLMETGSYIHVLPRVAHPIVATGPTVCVLLQVHRRSPMAVGGDQLRVDACSPHGPGAPVRSTGRSTHNRIAVGNAENDHALIDAAGLGIAVGNAVDSLRARPHIVLP
jgi:hypothetical protein